MNINGTGLVFNRGKGVNSLREALDDGWKPPNPPGNGPVPVYRVPDPVMKDNRTARKMRRADRFCRLAVAAAGDALDDTGLDMNTFNNAGILLAAPMGPHATTFQFLDDILDYGDANVSPTLFSNSVHNAAASYISSAFDIRGPTLTVTLFHFAFHQALLLAEAWLEEGRCDYVLVGSVDESAIVYEHIFHRKIALPDDGKIRPFLFSSSPSAVPGEGCVFFVVSRTNIKTSSCMISLSRREPAETETDLHVLDADGLAADESAYLDSVSSKVPVASYYPIWGSMFSGSAFSCAVGAVILQDRTLYPSPVTDNPHSINLATAEGSSAINSVLCTRYDCCGHKSSILLRTPRHQR